MKRNKIIYRKVVVSITLSALWVISTAQSPDLYPPTVPEEVDINLFNIVLYIVLPVIIIAAYFAYRYSQRKKQRKKEEEENENRKK